MTSQFLQCTRKVGQTLLLENVVGCAMSMAPMRPFASVTAALIVRNRFALPRQGLRHRRH